MKKLLNKKVITAIVATIFAIVGTFIAIPEGIEPKVAEIAVEKLVPADAE